MSWLQMVSVCYGVVLKIQLFVFKSLIGLTPSYLSDLLTLLLPSNLITLFNHWGQFDPSNLNLHNMFFCFVFFNKGLSQLIYVFVDYLNNFLS